MNASIPGQANGKTARLKLSLGQVVLVLVIVGVGVYTLATLIKGIDKDHRIDSAHVALIILALAAGGLLWQPGLLERISELKIGGVSLTLRRVERKLEDISLVVNLLLPEVEQGHLLRLKDAAEGVKPETIDYRVYRNNDQLLKQLRHLRKLKLIEMLGDQHFSNIPSGQSFMLTDYARLTTVGKSWADRLKEIDQKEQAPRA